MGFSVEQETKQRTAADVLLSLEEQVKQLMQMHRNLDLNIKILSNKFNQVIEVLTAMPTDPNPSLFPDPHAIATAPPSLQIPEFKMKIQNELPIPKETGLPIDAAPVGFRRTSRPESYSAVTPGDKNIPTPSIPQPEMHAAKLKESSTVHIPSSANKIPVMQRIVDKNGKSIFMAEVEITNKHTNIVEAKTRTNGVGKWQATLAPGDYKVSIRKREALNKQNIETSQDLSINTSTPNELQVLICR